MNYLTASYVWSVLFIFSLLKGMELNASPGGTYKNMLSYVLESSSQEIVYLVLKILLRSSRSDLGFLYGALENSKYSEIL